MMRRILTTALLAIVLTTAFAAVPKHTADSIASLLNQREIVCDKACPLFESENSNAGLVNTLFIDVLAIIGTVWLYTSYRKKYIFGIGALVVIVVSGSLLLRNNSNQCIEYDKSTCQIVSADKNPANGTSGLSDFEQMDPSSSKPATASADSDTAAAQSAVASSDEFSSMDALAVQPQAETAQTVKFTDAKILDPVIAFVLIALIAIGMRYRKFIYFRGLVLLFGLAWFGFYRGGCTCMISSFQNLFLGLAGWHFVWTDLLWIGMLVIATYLFGRIWCGWLCHLGAVQEFVYLSPKFKILMSARSQKILRIARYTIFIVWILQLVITHTNVFCSYDPFKSIFNMIFTDWVSIALVALLLISSVLIYRPFCRTICPVGVILGLISRIPGARKTVIKSHCVSCGLCAKECKIHAIHKGESSIQVADEDCIACGDCNTVCRKKAIKLDIK